MADDPVMQSRSGTKEYTEAAEVRVAKVLA
jgi:hypothetical protein